MLTRKFDTELESGPSTRWKEQGKNVNIVGDDDKYSIYCNTTAGTIDAVTFQFDGTRYTDKSEPWYLIGDVKRSVNPVEYLAVCGGKYIKLQGQANNKFCFAASFFLVAKCERPPTPPTFALTVSDSPSDVPSDIPTITPTEYCYDELAHCDNVSIDCCPPLVCQVSSTRTSTRLLQSNGVGAGRSSFV